MFLLSLRYLDLVCSVMMPVKSAMHQPPSNLSLVVTPMVGLSEVLCRPVGSCGVLDLMFRHVEGQDVNEAREAIDSIEATDAIDDIEALRAGFIEPGLGALTSRAGRIGARERNPKWKNPPFRIDMSTCINCDTCLRHCPPHFGAIFNHGLDVVIVPELCSGCGKCLPPVCPVDCIVLDPAPEPTPQVWWDYPLSSEDPYR
jgi:Na+-translocating ferredoxin:NAD+ oxidoreductase subunit B